MNAGLGGMGHTAASQTLQVDRNGSHNQQNSSASTLPKATNLKNTLPLPAAIQSPPDGMTRAAALRKHQVSAQQRKN